MTKHAKGTFIDCTICANEAGITPGGMLNLNSAPTVIGTVFCSNLPDNMSGFYIDGGRNRFISAPGVTGSCCLNGACVEITSSACDVAGGVYQGDGITCTGGLCTLGGCCQAGACSDSVVTSACAGAGDEVCVEQACAVTTCCGGGVPGAAGSEPG